MWLCSIINEFIDRAVFSGMQNEQKREEAASRSHVKQYYGADIEAVEDFKTSVCSNDEKLPPLVVQAMRSVHHEINSKSVRTKKKPPLPESTMCAHFQVLWVWSGVPWGSGGLQSGGSG